MFNCRSFQFYPSSNQLCPVLSIITQSSILVSLSTSLTQFSITSLLLSSWAIQTLLLFQGVNISCCKSVSLVVLGFLSLLFRQSLEGRIAIGLCDAQEDNLYHIWIFIFIKGCSLTWSSRRSWCDRSRRMGQCRSSSRCCRRRSRSTACATPRPRSPPPVSPPVHSISYFSLLLSTTLFLFFLKADKALELQVKVRPICLLLFFKVVPCHFEDALLNSVERYY